jgi:deoxyribodipyrimidine photo-lyase
MTKGLFIFRRDLRATDNTGLNEFCKTHSDVSCIFILDPLQINPKVNKYFSATAMLFMLDSLIELKKSIPLTILHGAPHKVIADLISRYKFDAVGYNQDYTPYSKKRDQSIESIAPVTSYKDVCLNSPMDIKPYKVFTPYYNVASKITVSKPVIRKNKLNKLHEPSVNLEKLKKQIESIAVKNGTDLKLVQRGGRTAALTCMKQFKCAEYASRRDMLTYQSSRISPHLKFGTISPREVYHACGSKMYRKQLYWRDFYLQIGYHFPKVYGYNFKNKIKWDNNAKNFKSWCDGKTGYDIVDACMNQLNKSGYMHNRGRMIVASFLTKILHIDWRLGEQYFASRLTDYDPANNNGGWQWSAGTGVDAQPYFRIFNPYTQAKRFDPNGEYRKQWLPSNYNLKPMVDYDVERVKALDLLIR